VDDPWRVFFTTDSPNGAPFTRYPELVRLLMDANYRDATLATLNPESAEMILLKEIKREYSLYELAITTRAAPAKLMGLTDRGHLGVGAIADIAVYTPNADYAAMFADATWLFKNGVMVVKEGDVLCEPSGEMLTLIQLTSGEIENELQSYFDAYFTMRLDHMKVNPMTLGSDSKPRHERSFATQTVV
jgi:formylmethanofuran dehydrogenase subunit A